LEWEKSILSEDEGQITIRHLFYRLVGAGVIPKTEKAYCSLVKHLSQARRTGEISWASFADSTRWHIKSESFNGMDDALRNTVETYRRNLWTSQKVYLEIWCEKDAMAGILSKAAQPFGVPIFVARGFASLTSLYGAALTFRGWAAAGKECIIYHFGDHDPSGFAAGESIMRFFREDFITDVKFIRAAVTREQVKRLNLLTRPKKKSTHSKAWTGGESVELDSMPPAEIRSLVEQCITQHIDQREWEVLKQTEDMERGCLKLMREKPCEVIEYENKTISSEAGNT
jgi:hypothetical protein